MRNFNFVGSQGWHFFLLLVCILAILCAGKTDAADENKRKSSKAVSAKSKSSGPYCGLYCLYSAMKITGRKEVDFRALVKPEYIGSRKGSSLAELKKAAEDSGMYAVPVGKLTSRVLHNCSHPVILHVKSDATSKEYDHYELFLGTENDRAKILNPPGPVRLVPFRELAPRWDGNGLIVSADPIDLGSVFAPARRRFAVYAAIAIAVILTVHYARRWLPQALLNTRCKLLGLSVAQGAALGIVALSCGMVYHFANDEGFLAHANATASIQEAHQGDFIPKISEKKVHKLLDTDSVFIDARLARDFKTGHLEGAINIPVDANDNDRQKTMVNITKDAHVVVYCQSSGCKFAEKVAIKLIEDGFQNVSIFKGGWREWAAKSNK